MTSGQLNEILRHLCRLVGVGSVEDLSDRQLLDAFAQKHDPAAFEVLVSRHGPMVRGICRRVLNDEHDAEDAFQATFMVLAKRAAEIRRGESVGSFVCGTAYRIALKARTQASRRRQQERQAGEMTTKTDPDNDKLWQELRPVLDEELNRLPEKYRAPLVLCYLQGKTNEAAARELGWAPGSMSYRLAQARDHLRVRLSKRGVALPAAAIAGLLAENAQAAIGGSLIDATVQASVAFAAGEAAKAGVSAGAIGLANASLKTVTIAKFKVAAALLISVGMIGGTLGVMSKFAGTSSPVPVLTMRSTNPGTDLPRILVRFSDSQRFGIAFPDPADRSKLKKLTREENGLTNNTCFRVDGLDYLFGASIPGVRWAREKNKVQKESKYGEHGTLSAFEHDNCKIRITQTVEIVRGEQTGLLDTVLVKYTLKNHDAAPHTVGLRMMLDTFIGTNDGVPFLIPPTEKSPARLMDSMEIFERKDMPAFIRALESDNLEDQHGTVAEMNLKLRGCEPLDRLVICRWPDNSEMRWDWAYRAMNDPADKPKDSCVVLYWAERAMKPGEERVLGFTYGLGQFYGTGYGGSQGGGGGGTGGKMRLLTAGSSKVGKTFTATAYIKNAIPGQKISINLPAGLVLEEGQKRDQEVPRPGERGYAQVSWRVTSVSVGTYQIKAELVGAATIQQEVRVTESSLFE